METIRDLVAEARQREGTLFDAADRAAGFSYEAFCVNAWKVGNMLRHYGVRPGERVAVVPGPKAPTAEDEPGWIGDSPASLLAVLGAAVDGAVVNTTPPGAVDATALVAPDAWLERYDAGPGTKQVAYGGPPEDPAVAHMEREAWSENPLQPPGEVTATDPALADDALYAHGDLLAASRRVVAEYDLDETDAVALRAPLTDAGALVAGVLAPMRVGATVLLGDRTGTVAVSRDDAPEDAVVSPDAAAPRTE